MGSDTPACQWLWTKRKQQTRHRTQPWWPPPLLSSVQGWCSYICKAPHLVYHRCFIQEDRIGNCGIQVRCMRAQLCLTLCDPVDCSPPGSTVQRILQASILKWVTIYYFRGSSRLGDWTALNLSPALQADSLLLGHLGSPIVILPSFNFKN